jgi:hypothetical protein
VAVIYLQNYDVVGVLDIDTKRIIKVSPEMPFNMQGTNDYFTVGPDNRIYTMVDWPSNMSIDCVWASIDPNLTEWSAGLKRVDMVMPDVGQPINPFSLSFGRRGLTLLCANSNNYWHTDATLYAIAFPSASSTHGELISTWGPGPDEEGFAEAPSSDGRYIYYTTEGMMVWAVDTSGGPTVGALNLNDVADSEHFADYDLSASVLRTKTNRIYAWGYAGRGSALGIGDYNTALFSGPWGAVGPYPTGGVEIHAKWNGYQEGPTGFTGSAVISEPYLFIAESGTIGRLNMDTGEWIGVWWDGFVDDNTPNNSFRGADLVTQSGGRFFSGGTPTRQFPRDDALTGGGSVRQRRQSRSKQSSERQGWAGTYA